MEKKASKRVLQNLPFWKVEFQIAREDERREEYKKLKPVQVLQVNYSQLSDVQKEEFFQKLKVLCGIGYEDVIPFSKEIAKWTIEAIESGPLQLAHTVSILFYSNSKAVEVWKCLSFQEASMAFENRKHGEITHTWFPEVVRVILKRISSDSLPARFIDTSATTLSEMTVCVKDAILPLVSPFILKHLYSPQWQMRDFAVQLVGAIQDGTSKAVGTLLSQTISAILKLLQNDETITVRESAAWAVGKVIQFHHCSLGEEKLQLVPSLLQALRDPTARVVSQVCWVSNCFSLTNSEAFFDELQTNKLFHVYPHTAELVQELWGTVNR